MLPLPTNIPSHMVLPTRHISKRPVQSTRIFRPAVSHNIQHSIPRDTLRNPSRPEQPPVNRIRLTERLHPSHHNNRKLVKQPLHKLLQDFLHDLVVYRMRLVFRNDPALVLRRLIPTRCSKCIWAIRFRHRPVQTRHQHQELPQPLMKVRPKKASRPELPNLQKPRRRNRARKTSRSKPDWCILTIISVRRRRWQDCQGTHSFPTVREKRLWKRSLLLQ